jgi:hypothetical protein
MEIDEEKLAEYLHILWVKWSRNLYEHEALSKRRIKRWNTLWVSYNNLPEKEKQKDRDIVKRFKKWLIEDAKREKDWNRTLVEHKKIKEAFSK